MPISINMKKFSVITALFIYSSTVFAQQDSVQSVTLEELVITATRTERKLSNVAVPVKIISQKTISQAGSVRLKDILQEQVGLFITNGFGAGVQMQGLNPDYTLILVNGEPLVGRTAGVLDINRLAVGNIKKIEIVKGPSSSLYGSEAMAGVINIITDKSYTKNISTGIRYGFSDPEKGWVLPVGENSFKNIDYHLKAGFHIDKFRLNYFGNANYLDGISFRPSSKERFPQPIWRLTNQIQMEYPLTIKTNLSVSLRHTYDRIKQEFAVSNNGLVTNSYGYETNKDFNINPVLTHKINEKLTSTMRLYHTRYNGLQQLFFKQITDSIYRDAFRQNFFRLENQTDIKLKNATLTMGAGHITDRAQSTRYDDFGSDKKNTVFYGFSQYDRQLSEKLVMIAGVRYDDNKLFASALSPKLAFRYKVNSGLALNASIGRGFKAPDFRQLYLNFTNNAAGGYSVFGSIDAVRIINDLKSRGLISDIGDDFNKLKILKPEFSTGINAGGTYTVSGNLSTNFNLFYNDINELIDVRQVATKSNGGQIFSYINIKNAYTRGTELEINYVPAKGLNISSGYQFLQTGDKDELKRIKNQREYTRNPDGTSRLLKKSEYIGLPNRSSHMANLKLVFENDAKFFITTRFVYRSKWAVANRDGNTVYNSNDEFANGFLLINISMGKELNNGMRINAGMDNLTNYQDVNYLPNQSGRTIYVGLQMNFINR